MNKRVIFLMQITLPFFEACLALRKAETMFQVRGKCC